MALRIPQNQIQFKYTSGGEYLYVDSYKEYQGHYYEANGKTFAGKKFNSNSPSLIKKDSNNINFLKLNPKTAVYANISNLTSTLTKIVSLPVLNDSDLDKEEIDTFYIQKIGSNIIKRVDQITYEKVIKNPLYIGVVITPGYFNLDQADKIMPGIKAFLSV